MVRMLKHFWMLPLSIMLMSAPMAHAHNDIWDGIIKRLFSKTKTLKLTAGRETSPTVKLTPKVLSFRGVLEVPSSIYLNRGNGIVSATSGQIIFDGQIVCNYSPSSNSALLNKFYVLKSCSDGSRAGNDINVASKVELRLNNAQSASSSLQASLKIIRQDEVIYGISFPYIQATEGQVLMYNGEAWVAVDPDELDIATGGGDGEVGPQGPVGPQGAMGPMGPQGPAGTPGAKGDKGDKGEKGDKGDAGVAGTQGLKGDKGDAGSPGPAGAAGAVGPQGPAGPMGPKGNDGAPGVAGAQGATGPQGPAGPMGPKGNDGAQGATGPQGPVGPMGPKGNDGAPGVAGATGPQGPVGPMGPKGSDGLPGAVGATGPQGPAGAMGLMGPMGPQGPAGADGLPGAPGAQGPQGPAGVQGPKGDKGESGLAQMAYLRDEKASGVNGGTCSTAWTTRELNTLGGDNSFISLANNRFVLQPGTYFIEVFAPGWGGGQFKAKLKVVETNSDVLIGTTGFSHTTNSTLNHSIVMGEVVVQVASTFEISQRCATERASFGLGQASNFGVPEIYTQIKIIKKQ